MKKILLIVLFILSTLDLNAQILFEEQPVFDTSITTNDQKAIHAVDLNGDGNLDVLASDNYLSWYKNGTFNERIFISFSASQDSFVKDMDGDGDLDIVSLNNDNLIYWYENLDGLGNFSTGQNVSTSTYGNGKIHVEDMDGDGDMDIVIAAYRTAAWFENLDGLGTFGSTRIIYYEGVWDPMFGTAYNFDNVHVADMDGDGDMDVITCGSVYYLSWFENLDGIGNFGPRRNINTNTFDGIQHIDTGDIDGDGDMDILVGIATFEFDSRFFWMRNNTDGGTTTTFSKNIILSTAAPFGNNRISSVKIGDIDNDGDVDVFAGLSTGGGSTPITAYTSWFENTDTDGNFGDPQIIATSDRISSAIDIGDSNFDGKVDVISTSSSGSGKISWYNQVGASNKINGTVTFDLDADGCDAGDITMENILVITNNGVNTYATFTNDLGQYNMYPTVDGTFSTTPTVPAHFSATPSAHTSDFVGFGNIDTANFCLEPIGSVSDLSVSTYTTFGSLRPGFNTEYQIVYTNTGNTQLSGDIVFEFDGTKMQFLNASETVSASTTNSITFDYMNLNPSGTRTIDLDFNVFPPPTTNIDDVLSFTASINPISGDATTSDNVFTFNQTVIGSYDPNDINVLEGSEVLIDDADNYLHYVIRFQNTGTASAINVRVENELDPNLDWTTMRLQSLSHTGRVEIIDGNMVRFIFDGIDLPDSTSDEPNSHGYITYKIKPKNTVVLGDVIENTADIYFDFNPPIITNTVQTEFVAPLSTEDFSKSSFSIYPNPTQNLLYINGKESITNLVIRDLNGKTLYEIDYNSLATNASIDIQQLAKGLYFLSLATEDGTYTHKIIKD